MARSLSTFFSDLDEYIEGEAVYEFIADPAAFATARGVQLGADVDGAFDKLFGTRTPDLTPTEMSPGGAVAAGARAAASSAAKSVADGALKAAGATAVAVGAKATGILSVDPDFSAMARNARTAD